jgi:hypothetical protein
MAPLTEAPMPSYLFCCTNQAASETVQRECQGREQAIQYARRYLERTLQDCAPATPPASVSVAEEHWKHEPVWLGSWDWSAEDGWVWAPLD